METLAYLLASQDCGMFSASSASGLSTPEARRFSLAQLAPPRFNLARSLSQPLFPSRAAIALLSLTCMTGTSGLLAGVAAAQAYEDDGLYPRSIYAFSERQAAPADSSYYVPSYGGQAYGGIATSYLLPEDSIYQDGYAYQGSYAYIQPERVNYYRDSYRAESIPSPCSANANYPTLRPAPVYAYEDTYAEDTYYSTGYSQADYYVPVRPAPVRSAGSLQYGDSSELVRSLQEQLRDAGYFSGASTGYFGSATEAAVIAFQQDYGLIVDGVAGSQTIATIQGEYF